MFIKLPDCKIIIHLFHFCALDIRILKKVYYFNYIQDSESNIKINLKQFCDKSNY